MTSLSVDPKNSNLHIQNPAPGNRTNLVIHNHDERSTVKLRRHTTDYKENDVTAYGGIYFEREDNLGVWTTGMIIGGEDYLLLTASKDGILDDPKLTLTFRDGKLGIANTTPEHEVDVEGSIRASKNIYGNLCIPTYTQQEIEKLTAINGMLVISEENGLILFLLGKWHKIQLGEVV